MHPGSAGTILKIPLPRPTIEQGARWSCLSWIRLAYIDQVVGTGSSPRSKRLISVLKKRIEVEHNKHDE